MVNGHENSDVQQATRREILTTLTALGIGTTVFQRSLAEDVASAGQLSADQVAKAEWVANLTLTEEERNATAAALKAVHEKLNKLRSIRVDYEQVPAFRFDPEIVVPKANRRGLNKPNWLSPTDSSTVVGDAAQSGDTPDSTPISTASIAQLGLWLRSGQLTSRGLTEYCLNQLKQHDDTLKCVITLTETLAIEQAEVADKELAAGLDRGPLHGIPWGAKDLIAVSSYPTTWGAPQFLEQYFHADATVYSKLCEAGAVLVAKLSLGALAMGDQWFGGQTRNPWNPEQGSSGSSAGSAAAVAAGCVPFALGSETLGSIISPTRRCGITSLRPTFGRISRSGCMPLSWTMDKIGPMARTVNDCGLVFNAIHGHDDRDPTTVDRWFEWPMTADLSRIRIGDVQNRPSTPVERILLQLLTDMGVSLVPIELPDEIDEWALAMMLDVEAATVFHELLASGDTNGLNAWPGIFRKSHFVSAVDFIHSSRLRGRLMHQMATVFEACDIYIGGSDLGITNLTGHPTIALPVTMTSGEHSQPACATLTSGLYDEATLLALASLVESAVGLPTQVPEAFLP